MICKECKIKPIFRGIKHMVCLKCNEKTIVNSAYSNICEKCSDDLIICQCCGKEIKPKGENIMSIKNVLKRLSDLKFEEDGKMPIGKVLKSIGVEIENKNLIEVLNNISEVWDTLDDQRKDEVVDSILGRKSEGVKI